MSSLVVAGDTSGSVTISAPAIAGSTTLTLPATSGTIVATANAQPGMTLLGTITPTAVNSVNLSGLTLTGYKQILLVVKNISTSGGGASGSGIYFNSDNSQVAGNGILYGNANSPIYGTTTVDLASGVGYGYFTDSSGNAKTGQITMYTHNITTSSTTLYFRVYLTTIFNAAGTFYIYGVA